MRQSVARCKILKNLLVSLLVLRDLTRKRATYELARAKTHIITSLRIGQRWITKVLHTHIDRIAYGMYRIGKSAVKIKYQKLIFHSTPYGVIYSNSHYTTKNELCQWRIDIIAYHIIVNMHNKLFEKHIKIVISYL